MSKNTIINAQNIKQIDEIINDNLYKNLIIETTSPYLDQLKNLNFKIFDKKDRVFYMKRKANNPYKNSDNNKRYYTLDYYNKKLYKEKVAKIPIDAGFTCPNIDGTKSFDGCTFCSIKGSGDFAGLPTDDLIKQWNDGYQMMSKKWPNAKYIAYFQAFSNTYAPVEVLRNKFEVFTNFEDCIGIDIATRPDCLDDEIIEYLADLNKRVPLIVELGLQTIHETTALIINRCHDLESFTTAVSKLREHNIEVVAHIINGLPLENYEMMIETAKFIGKQDIQGLKIHLLHVTSDTKLVNQLNNGFLKLLDQDTYIKLVSEQLQYINPNIVLHRLTGDAPDHIFIGPIWSRKKVIVLNKIDQYLEENDLYQGKLYNNS